MARSYGYKNGRYAGGLYRVLLGKQKTYMGYHWRRHPPPATATSDPRRTQPKSQNVHTTVATVPEKNEESKSIEDPAREGKRKTDKGARECHQTERTARKRKQPPSTGIEKNTAATATPVREKKKRAVFVQATAEGKQKVGKVPIDRGSGEVRKITKTKEECSALEGRKKKKKKTVTATTPIKNGEVPVSATEAEAASQQKTDKGVRECHQTERTARKRKQPPSTGIEKNTAATTTKKQTKRQKIGRVARVCPETSRILQFYDSPGEVARSYGFKNGKYSGGLHRALLGKQGTYKGYHWRIHPPPATETERP